MTTVSISQQKNYSANPTVTRVFQLRGSNTGSGATNITAQFMLTTTDTTHTQDYSWHGAFVFSFDGTNITSVTQLSGPPLPKVYTWQIVSGSANLVICPDQGAAAKHVGANGTAWAPVSMSVFINS